MDSLAQEAAALVQIAHVLDPLTPSARARVLLMVTLKTVPNAFSSEEYLRLIDAAIDPRQLNIPYVKIISEDVNDEQR